MRILLVGDTHANTKWWEKTVTPSASEVDADGIIQLGDFGWWAGDDGEQFIDTVAESKVPVWFLDGNHEDHPHLKATVEAKTRNRLEPVNLKNNLWFLPRGARLTFEGVKLAAVGGAVSIDRDYRSAGIDWFKDEELNESDLHAVGVGGESDILLCHDAPSGWDVPGLLPDHKISLAWRRQRPACEQHRETLRDALETTKAKLVVHGHYHVRYRMDRLEPWGDLAVEGLACDGMDGSMLVLDLHDKRWQVHSLQDVFG